FDVLNAYLRSPWPEFECSYRIRHKSGAYREMLCRGKVFPDPQGKLASILGTQIDLSERARPAIAAADSEEGDGAAADDSLRDWTGSLTRALEEAAGEIAPHFRGDSLVAGRIHEIGRLARALAFVAGAPEAEEPRGDGS